MLNRKEKKLNSFNNNDYKDKERDKNSLKNKDNKNNKLKLKDVNNSVEELINLKEREFKENVNFNREFTKHLNNSLL